MTHSRSPALQGEWFQSGKMTNDDTSQIHLKRVTFELAKLGMLNLRISRVYFMYEKLRGYRKEGNHYIYLGEVKEKFLWELAFGPGHLEQMLGGQKV